MPSFTPARQHFFRIPFRDPRLPPAARTPVPVPRGPATRVVSARRAAPPVPRVPAMILPALTAQRMLRNARAQAVERHVIAHRSDTQR